MSRWLHTRASGAAAVLKSQDNRMCLKGGPAESTQATEAPSRHPHQVVTVGRTRAAVTATGCLCYSYSV